MDLFTYIVTSDSGFAPNPFGGFCTLATCKPKIRAKARLDDWVAGLGSVRAVGAGRLVFAMLIAEVVPLEVYGEEARFAIKRPSAAAPWQRVGDNLYFKAPGGEWRQRRGRHGPGLMVKDLSGLNALLADEFYYFGAGAPELPRELRHIIKQGPGHRRLRGHSAADALAAWLRTAYKPGLLGAPWENRPGSAGLSPGPMPAALRC